MSIGSAVSGCYFPASGISWRTTWGGQRECGATVGGWRCAAVAGRGTAWIRHLRRVRDPSALVAGPSKGSSGNNLWIFLAPGTRLRWWLVAVDRHRWPPWGTGGEKPGESTSYLPICPLPLPPPPALSPLAHTGTWCPCSCCFPHFMPLAHLPLCNGWLSRVGSCICRSQPGIRPVKGRTDWEERQGPCRTQRHEGGCGPRASHCNHAGGRARNEGVNRTFRA